MSKHPTQIIASDFVRSSLEAYAKEVIEDRSLPDFRDGLKISQRRILYYMWSEGLNSSGNYKATANVVGGVMGKLHPHGDSSLHSTLVNLNSNVISPVDGDGAWGDIHTEAAAMRYTKVKMSSFGDCFCEYLNIADYMPTYSGDWQEPIIIPSPIPYALLAGTSGIAVAVATSIPSHNLTELVNAFIAVLHGEHDIEHIIGNIIFAPESKTGGVCVSTLEEIQDMYRKGKGKIRWRCDYSIVFDKNKEEWSLIVTGIPEAFQLSSWLTKMKMHAESGMLRIENESCSDDPIRFVITFNNIAFFYDVIENSLYCNETYNFNLISKSGERAVDISLQHHTFLSWVDAWLSWREDIEIKIVKSNIEKLEKDLDRETIKQWVSENIDDVISCIKNSQNPSKDLKEKFNLENYQVKIIIEMQLQSLSKLSRERQSKIIKNLNSKIEMEKKKLKKPKLLVENTLKSLLMFEKGSKSKFDYGDKAVLKNQTALKKSEGKPNYWAIETTKPRTLHQIGSEISLRKRILNPYLNVVNANDGIVTVTEKGEVKKWAISELCEKDIGYSYVNILSPNEDQLILSCSNGIWANYSMQQSVKTWTAKILHSGEDKILSAVSYNAGDILWVYSPSTFESVSCCWEVLKRTHKQGWKGKGKNLRLLTIPKYNNIVIDKQVIPFTHTINPSKQIIESFLKAKNVYIYNPKDAQRTLLCIASDGSRHLMTGDLIDISNLDLIQTYSVT